MSLRGLRGRTSENPAFAAEMALRLWVKSLLAAIAALTLLAAPVASAQVPDPYARELAQKLTQAQTVLAETGYARGAGPFAGGLGQGGSYRFNVTLRAGQDYRIVGVCDERCRDLDMRLFDPNGQLLAQDVLEDSVPVIHVIPGFTGQHTVEVTMPRCGGPQCWFAATVYAR